LRLRLFRRAALGDDRRPACVLRLRRSEGQKDRATQKRRTRPTAGQQRALPTPHFHHKNSPRYRSRYHTAGTAISKFKTDLSGTRWNTAARPGPSLLHSLEKINVEIACPFLQKGRRIRRILPAGLATKVFQS
jgi:hypothetical protein